MILKRKDLSEYQKWAYKQPHTMVLMLAKYFLVAIKFVTVPTIYILIAFVSVLRMIFEKLENALYGARSFLERKFRTNRIIGTIICIKQLESIEKYKRAIHPLNRYWRYVPHKYFEKLEQLKKEE